MKDWERKAEEKAKAANSAQTKPAPRNESSRNGKPAAKLDETEQVDYQPSWPAPIEKTAYHGLAGEFVRIIDPHTEADPVALLSQFLVGFGAAAGRNAYFNIEAGRHYPNEFAVLVGDTAKARKGTSWYWVDRVLAHADEGFSCKRIASGASSGEGLIYEMRDGNIDAGAEDKRLLLLEQEFAGVLKQTERNGNTLSMILRCGWDGAPIRSLTKNNPLRATDHHIAVIGHVTIDELRRYLTSTEVANGFGNRHLFLCVRRSKLLPDGGNLDPNSMADFGDDIAASLTFAKEVRRMRRDCQASALWHDVYPQLTEARPGIAGSLLARAEAHVLRLSMIYALLDRCGEIQKEHLLAALALQQYAEESIRAIFGDSLGDHHADEILRLLRSTPDGLTRSQISTTISGGHVKADRLAQALATLVKYGKAVAITQKTGGRTAEIWQAC